MDLRFENQYQEGQGYTGNSGSLKFWIMLGVILILAGAFAYFNIYDFVANAKIKKDAYQAVFLTNGQVYFGHMEVSGKWVIINDIYYLQLNNQLQPASSAEVQQQVNQQNVQLVKLGNELHGPEDVMYIERDKLLFWENLKPTSSVMKSILSGK